MQGVQSVHGYFARLWGDDSWRNWQTYTNMVSLCLYAWRNSVPDCQIILKYIEHDVWIRLARFGFGRCFSAWMKGFHDWVRLYSLLYSDDVSLCCAKLKLHGLPNFHKPHRWMSKMSELSNILDMHYFIHPCSSIRYKVCCLYCICLLPSNRCGRACVLKHLRPFQFSASLR